MTGRAIIAASVYSHLVPFSSISISSADDVTRQSARRSSRSIAWQAFAACIAVVIFVLAAVPNARAQSVAAGSTLYNTNALPPTGACAGCHFGNPPPNTAQGISAPGHPLAANNPAKILTAMSPGGLMAGFFSPIPSSAQLFNLALYIG